MTINKNIFNVEKSDYSKPSLFLGEPMGLLDSVNKHYPELHDHYLKMKSQDWSHTEFNFTSCNTEFKSGNKDVSDIMKLTLAWQWEADSIASRSLFAVMAPFISSNELSYLWQRITENESLHALTYSEIVRSSFDDPNAVLGEILSITESFKRLERASKVFNDAYIASHKYALGLISKEEAYPIIFLFLVTMYIFERIQFMDSFTITFTIANSGIFVPIGKAVQKICQDELEVHCKVNETILNIELKTERGLNTFNKYKSKITEIFHECVEAELNWNRYLFNGRELPGLNLELLNDGVLHNAKPVKEFLGIESQLKFPEHNPLWSIDEWINIDKIQPSPQEEKTGAYLLGGIKYDSDSEDFDLDGL